MTTQSISLLYGMSLDLDWARAEIELALDLTLDGRDSSYLGDYYKGRLPTGHNLVLRRNVDPMHNEGVDPPEERFAEPDHSQYCTLLYVDGPASGDSTVQSIVEKVPGVALIKRRVFEIAHV